MNIRQFTVYPITEIDTKLLKEQGGYVGGGDTGQWDESQGHLAEEHKIYHTTQNGVRLNGPIIYFWNLSFGIFRLCLAQGN